MNLYLRELKRNSKSLIIWTIVLSALILMLMSIYPSMAKDSENFNELMKTFPKELMDAFNMGEIDFSEVFGYYSVEGYLFVTLFGGIFAILLGSGILSKEQGDKTIEFLLSKPILRKEIVTSKLLALLTNIVILNIFLSLSLFLSIKIFDDNEMNTKIFMLLCIAPFILQLSFGTFGFFISLFMKKSRQILSASLGVVLSMYFLSIIYNVSDKFEFLKYFTFFEYVNAASIINDEKIKGIYLLIFLIVNVLLIGMTYVVYEKKDITV